VSKCSGNVNPTSRSPNKKFFGVAVARAKAFAPFLAFPKTECRLIRVRRYRQDLGETILDLGTRLPLLSFFIQGRSGKDPTSCELRFKRKTRRAEIDIAV